MNLHEINELLGQAVDELSEVFKHKYSQSFRKRTAKKRRKLKFVGHVLRSLGAHRAERAKSVIGYSRR